MQKYLTATRFFLGLIALQISLASAQAAQDKTYDLEVEFSKDAQHRVDMQFEHKGKVVMDGTDEENYSTLPMNTVAKLGYYQRYTGRAKDNQAVRFYDKSKGQFRISKGNVSAELGDANRLIVSRVKSQPGKRIQMASALSTLNQAELELLKNPVDPLSLPSLVNKKGIQVNEKWKPDDDGLANFLSLDRILQNDVKLFIKDVKSGIARVYMSGKLKAAVDDVMTEMEVTSILRIDLTSKMVSSVRLGIREIRQPGQLAPGFDGQTTIDLTLKSDSSCKHLTNESLSKYTKSRVIEQRLKWESALGRFQLKYDPRWRMITAEQEGAILRFLSNGMLLAQCNVVQLPSRPANKPLTMKEYKHEIAKVVTADPKARIVDTDEFKTSQGGTAMKIEVLGEEEGVPVTWLYYQVSNKDGRRLTFVFTMEEEVSGLFKPADKAMVNALQFFPKAKRKSTASTSDEKNSTRR
jgi:hypothetical protein